MHQQSSTTKWRDTAIVPEQYDNLAALCTLARKARHLIVQFDMVFSRDDLLRLRDAVHNWGSQVVGRFRLFDARMLTAINTCLGEPMSTLVLKEPKNTQGLDIVVACVACDGAFRLQGHATFDIVFAYGAAGFSANPSDRLRLGETASATLANAVSMLGWDLKRLSENRWYRPVLCAIYGVKADGGDPLPESSPCGEPTQVEVHFHGPFAATKQDGLPCLFDHSLAAATGVYLWTLLVDGEERAWYIGQTRRSFGQRIAEHITGFLSGQYHIADIDRLLAGDHHNEWRDDAGDARWPQTLPSFLRQFDELAPKISRLVGALRFYVAEVKGTPRLHDRIEGTIGRHFKEHIDSEGRRYFTPGIKLPSAIPGELPRLRLRITSARPIVGLPDELG